MRYLLIFYIIAMPVLALGQIQASNNYTPPPPVPAQTQNQTTKAQLEAKRRELQEAINATERELTEIKQNKKATISQLRALQYKLAQRQRLIGNINDEIDNIDETIEQSSKEILTLKQRLQLLKERYAQSVRYAYTNRSSYDMLAFLFSSNDFNDALRRMKYLKKFRDFRKTQVDQIQTTQTQISKKIDVLNKEKEEKDELLNTQKEQSTALQGDVQETNNTIQDLKGREAELQRIAEKNKKAAARITKYISDIIEREMQASIKKAQEEERKRLAAAAKVPTPAPGSGTKAPTIPSAPKPARVVDDVALMLTPTDIALANSFEGNHGKLYWPVAKGIITDRFGTHRSPIAEKVMVVNSGIDIRTHAGAAIRAVFEGTVSTVLTVEGKQIVMVQHGNFFTVYNNLSTVSVNRGDHVGTLQNIGVVANNDEGEPTVNFQIWKMNGKKVTVKLDPESWIGKAR
jgi:murein hydrolase activator